MILFLGRLHPIRGVDGLVDALFCIQRDFPNAVLVLAGPDEWGYLPKYKRTITELGLDRRVLLPAIVSVNLKLALLSRADLFVMPSRALESVGISLLDTLGAGCPAVAPRVAAIPEALEPILLKCLSPAGDSDALARLLNAYLDGSLRLPSPAMLRQYVQNRYSRERLSAQYLDLICPPSFLAARRMQ